MTTRRAVGLVGAELSPESRDTMIGKMSEAEVDILVVGGGVVGAGSALDAVTRGLSTAIVEARDWASGTSSRSSKLIHGGLRYLEQFEFGLVHEALRERGLLLNVLAPHLVRPVPFMLPLTEHWLNRPRRSVRCDTLLALNVLLQSSAWFSVIAIDLVVGLPDSARMACALCAGICRGPPARSPSVVALRIT